MYNLVFFFLFGKIFVLRDFLMPEGGLFRADRYIYTVYTGTGIYILDFFC